jgi:hypothetical protein
MNNQRSTNSHSTLETIVVKERLRQSRYSFNAALASAVLSTCISVIGVTLLLSGKVPEGAATTSSGMAASLGCFKLAKDANDRLDSLTKELMNDT